MSGHDVEGLIIPLNSFSFNPANEYVAIAEHLVEKPELEEETSEADYHLPDNISLEDLPF